MTLAALHSSTALVAVPEITVPICILAVIPVHWWVGMLASRQSCSRQSQDLPPYHHLYQQVAAANTTTLNRSQCSFSQLTVYALPLQAQYALWCAAAAAQVGEEHLSAYIGCCTADHMYCLFRKSAIAECSAACLLTFGQQVMVDSRCPVGTVKPKILKGPADIRPRHAQPVSFTDRC